jgi:hypothetical protein
MCLPDLSMVEVNQLLASEARQLKLKAGEPFPWTIIQKLLLLKNLQRILYQSVTPNQALKPYRTLARA